MNIELLKLIKNLAVEDFNRYRRENLHLKINLSGADLQGANLEEFNLLEANLEGANLEGANLKDSFLRYANLKGANLKNTNMQNSFLYHANLTEANLSGANLKDANLTYANLLRTNLSRTNLFGAKLVGANLTEIITSMNTIGYYQRCPQEGSYVAYKQTDFNTVVKLLILEGSLRTSATTGKCRASKVKVLEFYNFDGTISDKDLVYSLYDSGFTYTRNEVIIIKDFNPDRWIECSKGIHHYMTFEEAVNHKF